ncbi:MAG: PepSY-like domain-containing protein [Alistipes sp.]|nr:PepSY-like domain-containing protein [Alistipes sp.]
MRKMMFVIMMFAVAVFTVGCDDDRAPKSTRNAFNAQYPSAVDVDWDKKRGYSVAEFHLSGEWGECEAWYDKSGNWVMTAFDMRYSDLPAAVRTSFETEYGTQTPVGEVERLERNNADTIYFIEAQIVFDGYLTFVNLDYSADGTLLRTSVDVEDYENYYYYLP